MPNDLNYYRNLLKLYLSDELGIKEIQELFDFINGEPDQAAILLNEDRSLIFEEELVTRVNLSQSISSRMQDRLLNEIRKNNIVNSAFSGELGKVQKTRVLPLIKWWAAAAIFLITVSGAYLLLHQRPPVSQELVQKSPATQQDVMPGKSGAILTLSDGRQVVLDSLGNGTIARQGKTEVKLQNGQLLYDKDDGKGFNEKVVYNTMTTPKGRQYKVILADGTQVWLNTASSLKYPTSFTGNSREVEVKGEAYFEVAKNEHMPFIVKINEETRVQVLGTHFNINAYSNEGTINTTLLEGSVKMTTRNHTRVLIPGQQAQVNAKAGSIRLVSGVDMAQVIAWKNGAFSFTNADLPTVMRQLERWYNVEVSYAGSVPRAKFDGEIGRSLTLSQVLKILTHTRIKFKIENGNKIIILPDE